MTLSRLFPAAVSVFALAGCATAPNASSALPSNREVVAYVAANWSDSYGPLFAYLNQRPGQPVVLVSVKDVECATDDGDARCSFAVQGRFGDGSILQRPMDSAFRRRADGSIVQLIPVVVE